MREANQEVHSRMRTMRSQVLQTVQRGSVPKTFGDINKELEVAHIKVDVTSDPKQRREILVEMRKLLKQADDLVQELQRKIASK
jgi:hypothetical protein